MDDPKEHAPAGKKRRAYAKPELRSYELFERRSLTCGPTPNARPPACGTIHQSVN